MKESGTISVRINGKEREIRQGLSVDEMLRGLDLNPEMVVVELNRGILDRSRYGETLIEEEDVLELVHFVGGG
jgi:thiamine biosynthesis protein ThiS